jgi:hypothetical protein
VFLTWTVAMVSTATASRLKFATGRRPAGWNSRAKLMRFEKFFHWPLMHRWARWLKHQSSFADQGTRTSIFLFSVQQTNGSLPFSFPLAANKWKLPFSISSLFRKYIFCLQKSVHGSGFLEFRGSRKFFGISSYFSGILQNSMRKIQRNYVEWTKHGIKILGNSEVLWKKNQTGKQKTEVQAIFIKSVYGLLIVKTKILSFAICWRRNKGSYPFANGLNRLNGLNGLAHLWQNVTSWPGPE